MRFHFLAHVVLSVLLIGFSNSAYSESMIEQIEEDNYTFSPSATVLISTDLTKAGSPQWISVIHDNTKIEVGFLAFEKDFLQLCGQTSLFRDFFGAYSAAFWVYLDGNKVDSGLFSSLMTVNYQGKSYCGVIYELTKNAFNTSLSITAPGTYKFAVDGRIEHWDSPNVIRYACSNPLPNPLYTSRFNGYYHNSYMSTDYSLHLSALSQGYVATNNTARIENQKLRNDAHAFIQFFNQGFINHYYGWRPEDIAYVLSDGWRQERIEGYIYSTQVPGTVPLYSFWRNWNSAWDLEHRYTTNVNEKNQWSNEGHNYHSIMGYVCP